MCIRDRIDAGNRLVVEAEVMREAICRLLLIEPLHDCDFRSDAFQGFLLSTPSVSASDVSAVRLRDLERTAENALSTLKKLAAQLKTFFCPVTIRVF